MTQLRAHSPGGRTNGNKDRKKFVRKPANEHGRTPSYGSCDGAADSEAPARRYNGRPQMFRYQIGSEVFDFGESPVVWPGPLRNRLYKIPSKKAFSWLGFSDVHNQSEATLPRPYGKQSQQPALSIRGDTVNCPVANREETASMASNAFMPRSNVPADITPAKGPNKVQGRTVFSLFGLDRNQTKAADTTIPSREAEILAKSPRAQTATVRSPKPRPFENQDEPMPHLPAWVQTEDGPRSISLSTYLDEISKVGANGARNNTPRADELQVQQHD